MAKLEDVLQGNIYEWLAKIQHGILHSNTSASLEDSSDFICGNTKCCVHVFERYSLLGGNRLSLNLTLLQIGDGPIHLSAITAGGSCGVIVKINTWGEKNFLNDLRDMLYQ